MFMRFAKGFLNGSVSIDRSTNSLARLNTLLKKVKNITFAIGWH